MNKWILPITAGILLSACAAQPGSISTGTPTQSATTGSVNVEQLGRRIWANECAGSVQGLVSWNSGEDFPSLGIGHFIWYPEGYSGPFDESFPKFVAYARSRGVTVPAMFNGKAPWANKQAFLADKSGKADQMRRWLAANVGLQTEFIIRRSRAALPTMMAHSSNPAAVQAHYNALAATTQGMYCLVDYVNFKGEGIKDTDRYKGEGWGLTTDGEMLYMSDGTPDIRVLDPQTLEQKRRIGVTCNGVSLPYLNELEWIDGKIWANVYTLDQIVIINPQNGVVEKIVNLQGILPQSEYTATTDVLNGIAYDSEKNRIFVTGKNWSKMFEIKLL